MDADAPADFEDMQPLTDTARVLGVPLSAAQVGQFRTLGEMLVRDNAHINLTAITDPTGVQIRHFADSLSVVPTIDEYVRSIGGDIAMLSTVRVFDVGSGAGFPGLPIAIVRPHIAVTLIEATGKKVAFIRRVADDLGITNATALPMRAEDAGRHPTLRGHADIVIARAVARLPVLLEYCLPLLRQGGFLLAMKSDRRAATDDNTASASPTLADEIRDSRGVAVLLGGTMGAAIPVVAPGLEGHVLVRVDRTGVRPNSYPRRPGLPAKNPLGESHP